VKGVESTVERLALTVEEAAQALGVSRSTMYGFVSSGEIRSIKLGKCRRIPVDALAELIQRKADEQN
jgi:excisionase family DNA binding protein